MDSDEIGARMAFKESYAKAMTLARDAGVPVKWTPSLGQDQYGRECVLTEAVRKGRLTAPHVAKLLPHLADSPQFQQLLVENKLLGMREDRAI
jgi:hypothetical protein